MRRFMKIPTNISRFGATGIVMGCMAIFLMPIQSRAQGAPSQDINDYICGKLDDFTAVMKVVQHDDDAGAKINRDFPKIYQLKGNVKVQYKEENKLRLDARIQTAAV